MSTAFEDLLRDPTAQRVALVTCFPYDPDAEAEVALYYSDAGFITEPGDDPPNCWFDARVEEALTLSESLFDGSRLRGVVVPDVGAIVLNNADGGLDFLAGLAWDGRKVIVELGGVDFGYADYGTVWTGTAEGAEIGKTVTIRLRDLRYKLDVEIQEAEFAGTGEAEGTDDHKGRLKPLLYGVRRQIAPVYMGQNAGGRHWYMVHDGEIFDIPTVRTNGFPLTKVTGDPVQGEYRVLATMGGFELGGSHLETTITCDAQGAVVDGTYLSTVADIAVHIVTTRTTVTAAEVKPGTQEALNLLQPAAVGVYLPEGGRVLEVLETLCDSIGAYMGFGRDGQFELGRVEAPAPPGQDAAPEWTFEEIFDLRRLSAALPIKGARVHYRENNTEVAQVAEAVSAEDRAMLAARWRTAPHSDPVIAARHMMAEIEDFETALDVEADAEAEAVRLVALYGAPREVFEAEVGAQPLSLKLGAVVRLVDDRFGLADGKDFRIVALAGALGEDAVTMTVWG